MTIFHDGARLVPDIVTEAEERRILLPHLPGAVAHRSQPPRAALWLQIRLQEPQFRPPRPGARLPAVGRGHRRQPSASLRRPAARTVHRQRVPPRPGDRHARRPRDLRAHRGFAVAGRRLADELPAPQRPPLRAPAGWRPTRSPCFRAAPPWSCAARPDRAGCTGSMLPPPRIRRPPASPRRSAASRGSSPHRSRPCRPQGCPLPGRHRGGRRQRGEGELGEG